MVILTTCKGDREPNAEKRVQVEIVVETSSNAKVEVHHCDKESDDEKVDETAERMSATSELGWQMVFTRQSRPQRQPVRRKV